jgi:hypothetical protein
MQLELCRKIGLVNLRDILFTLGMPDLDSPETVTLPAWFLTTRLGVRGGIYRVLGNLILLTQKNHGRPWIYVSYPLLIEWMGAGQFAVHKALRRLAKLGILQIRVVRDPNMVGVSGSKMRSEYRVRFEHFEPKPPKQVKGVSLIRASVPEMPQVERAASPQNEASA